GAAVGFDGKNKSDAQGRFRIALRENKRAIVMLRKDGYGMRNWNDVPPGTKDATFVLYPGDLLPAQIKYPRERLPKPQALIGKPAPQFEVEQWLFGKADGPKDPLGQKTLLLFEWGCDDPASVAAEVAELDRVCDKAGVRGIVIFGARSHESGVRATFADHTP